MLLRLHSHITSYIETQLTLTRLPKPLPKKLPTNGSCGMHFTMVGKYYWYCLTSQSNLDIIIIIDTFVLITLLKINSFQDSGVIYFSDLKIKTAKCRDFSYKYQRFRRKWLW